ncbi:MAG: hypothetical protein LBP64_07240 [Tannerella sp.]|nr:hypothetical protein [Tannerella sp.]
MSGKLPVDNHHELFRTRLPDLINPEHELALLSNKIDRQYFEEEFKSLYSDRPSRPSMPIRFMVGVPMLKHLYSLGDERIISYLKYSLRMFENYFWGKVGIQINAFMSGTAWNLKKMMRVYHKFEIYNFTPLTIHWLE